MELFLRNVPDDVEPIVMFFKDGAFADRIRKLGIRTVIVAVDDNIQSVKRERISIRSFLALPGAIASIRKALHSVAPDVVYTNGIKAHMLGSLSATTLGIPSVVHHRDILSGVARLVFLITISVSTKARIATSRNVARCYPLPRTMIIDNPVDVDAYRVLPDRGKTRAAFGFSREDTVAAVIGRINRWKGIDRFLKAVAKVNESVRLRAMIVGAPVFRDADLLSELQLLSKQLNIEHLVDFVGWADDPRSVYASIDINVNASHREPFGRTIIEAAACGVPSVCFDDAGVAETMIDRETGLLVDSGDDTALARALTHYVRYPEARRAAGEASRSWSQRFDATKYALRVSEVLRAAGAPRRRSTSR